MVLGFTQLAKAMSRLDCIRLPRLEWWWTGAVILSTGAGAWLGGSLFVREQLAPLIAQELSHTLNRPVMLGAVERASWTGVRFGPATIPATATDPDYVRLRGIEVQFQPWQLLRERRLDVKVGLLQPEAVLHQSSDRRWLRLTPVETDLSRSLPFAVQVTQVWVRDGQVTLVPWATRRAQTYRQMQAQVQVGATQITFATTAQTPGGGTVRLAGTWDGKTQTLQARIQPQAMALVPVGEWMTSAVSLPVQVHQGHISGDVQVTWRPGAWPQVMGPMRVQGLVVGSPLLGTVPLAVQADAHFTPQEVRIRQGELQLAGKRASVTGRVHFHKGYDLTARVPAAEIAQLLHLWGRSFPVQGQVQSEWVVRGALTQPQIRGHLATVGPMRVRQTTIQQAAAEVMVAQGGLDVPRFQVQLAGVQVQGTGRLDAHQRLAMRFQGQAQAERLLPPGQTLPVRVGTVAFQGSLTGTLAQPRVQLAFQAPHAGIPLRGQAQWQAERLYVQARGSQVEAVGSIHTRTLAADVQVQVRRYDLRHLPVSLPLDLALRGEVDVQGRLRGTLHQPEIVGNLGVTALRVNHWQFEPYLRGTVRLTPTSGLRADVRGVQDQVALWLQPGKMPQSLTVRRGQAVIQAQGRDGRLAMQFQHMPLALLSGGLIQGDLQGAALWDAAQQQATGELQVTQARWGNLVATQLGGQFQWRNREFILRRGVLHQSRSRYEFTAQAQFHPQWRWQAQIQAVDAAIEDLVPALMAGSQPGAEALAVTPVGKPDRPLGEQLAYFQRVQTQVQQYLASQQKALGLPDVQELRGRWQGQATLQGNHCGEWTAAFDLRGRDWVWGPYQAERLTLQGRYKGTLQGGRWTLQPLQLVRGPSQILFTGMIGGAQQTGQLLITRIPAEYITQWLALPGVLTGVVSGTATLGGSQANPQAKGELRIEDGSWEQTPIQVAQTSFHYAQGRLDFGAELLVSDQTSGVEPVRVVGSLPFSLPLRAVKAADDRIRLGLHLKDSGLSLVNSFNPFVRWQGGSGSVQVDVAGTWREPRLSGVARFEGAKVALAGLGNALEQLTGEIRFLDDRLVAHALQAQLNGGTLTLAGVLPMSRPLPPGDPAAKQPLTLTLLPARIVQKDVYRGQASAQIRITGTARAPVVGGDIHLSQGQVTLSERLLRGVAQEVAPNGDTRAPKSNGGLARFQNLNIRLGQGVQVVFPPHVNVMAQGTLALHGSMHQPQPSGMFTLDRGEVNLFLTRFRLDRTYTNRVVFDPRHGFDPELDLRLTTTVTQGAHQREGTLLQRQGNFPNEVPITVAERVQGLETVRIQASIAGRASRLPNGLELSSNPKRTQEQIIALLGGFANRSSVESPQLFLGNLAGQTLLNQISRAHETDFGGISWRFFPTVLPALPDSPNLQQSALALGGEVRLDIHRFSASFLQMFTSFGDAVSHPNLSQLQLTYRINHELRLRAASSSDRDNRLIIEYSKQF